MHKPIEKFSQEELDTMKASAIDFLLKDIESLKHFIEKINKDFGQRSLAFALKMFILNCNKVFNMTEYMKKQSELAEEHLKSQKREFSLEERRAFLTHWIEDNAGSYRKKTIFKQIYCIDQISSEIAPIIAQAIKA